MTTATNDLTATLLTLSRGMETIMDRLAKLEGQAVIQPNLTPEIEGSQEMGTLTLPDGITLDMLKMSAKRAGLEIRGKVTRQRIDQWLALYLADKPTQPKVSTPKVTQGQSSDSIWGEFAQREVSAERRYGQPKAAEATEMFRVHPERDFVNSFPVPALYLFCQAGKDNAKVSEFKRIPLNGNQRKCIALLAGGKNSDSVKLVVADAVLVAKSAGVDIVSAIRRYNSSK